MKYGNTVTFLEHFNHDSYNKGQIGSDKKIITVVYDYLKKINISNEDIQEIISDLAYQTKGTINIPLYLELISKSFGFINEYELETVLTVVKEIHDVYNDNCIGIPLEEFIHDTEETQLKKLFLGKNNKYILKSFKKDVAIKYIADLKFAAAIVLEQKEYQEFLAYIDDYDNYQETYSPLILFKTYMKVRKSLKDTSKLFWDVLFGNEYIVSLNKNNITIKQIFKENIYNENEEKLFNTQQLNLFTLEEEPIVKKEHSKEVKSFQLSTIYNSKDLPIFDHEKEIIMYFRTLGDNKDMIVLPKLRNNKISYSYNVK